MNQMQKRLEIIKIAISMTDEETIRLQLLKLEHFEDDSNLGEIIAQLKQKYYAKAQVLITEYNAKSKTADETNKEIVTQEVTNQSNTNNAKVIIKEFALLKPINKNSITIKITNSANDIEEKINYEALETDSSSSEIEIKDDMCIDTENDSKYDANHQNQHNMNDTTDITETDSSGEQIEESLNTDSTLSTGSNNFMYAKIPDISTIFHNTVAYYLSKSITIVSKSATAWMKHIENGGYTDDEIYKILLYINQLKEKGNFLEAEQLAVLCGSTESNLGRLLFARELIKGDIFEKNEIKAFELIKELALAGYDEAICDYGQLVEHGIGTQANSKHAEELYKDAVALDSERARRLYEAIRKKNNKFLSYFRS
jgi:hypothetical protein